MRRWALVLVAVAAATLLGGRAASVLYADWAWYTSQDALAVWRSSIAHRVALRGGGFALAFAFAFANLYALRRSIISLVLPRRLGNIEIGEAVSPRMLLASVIGAAFVAAAILSAPVSDWTTFALARLAGPFREMDPYLDRDLAFVVAWLPFERESHAWAARLVVSVSVVTLVLYALTPSLRLRPGDVYVSAYCRRHVTVLAALGLALLAWRSRLDALSVTSTGSGGEHPFGAYAHHVGGPLLLWLSVLAVVAAVVVMWGGWNGYPRVAALAGFSIAVGGPMVEFALPRITGRNVTPSELDESDRPYATTRRLFTRRAFGADEVNPAGADPVLPRSARDARGSVPVWDPVAIARSVAPGSTQQRVTLAWRVAADGIRVAAIVAPRTDGGAWAFVEYDATEADERGFALPAIPDARSGPAAGSWPDILVFPGAVGARIVADSAGRLAAPAFGTWLERVAHAWNVRSPGLATAPPVSPRPRIAFRRDVRERVAAIAPFLTVGPTIVPLVRDDSLYWVAELYTVAAAYPLSDELMFAGRLRPYVHHAATAFVHAATGRTLLVESPDADAVMRAWRRRFPALFASWDELPAALRTAHPPATDWALLQATALARTGLGPAAGLGSPRAAVGTDNADADLRGDAPTLFALPGRGLAWSMPLVDAGGFVTGLVVGRGGPGQRAQWIPTDVGVRWSDLLDRLQRSADSAGVGRQRPGARRGRVLAFPAGTGVAFVQSHYEWTTDAAPVLSGVATVTEGAARAGASFREALGLPPPPGREGAAFRAAVEVLHRRMREALRQGDWTAFGAAFGALGQLLRPPGR